VGEEKDRHENVGIWVVSVLAVHTLEAVSYSYVSAIISRSKYFT